MMLFQPKSLLVLTSVCLGVSVATAIPVAEPIPVAKPIPIAEPIPVPAPDPMAHMSPVKDLLAPRANKPQRPPHDPNCPSTQPVSQNLCTSGSPYCCSGSGSGAVCGPASSTTCTSTTICCINTNGMQICAGEIDFNGPVTINININL